MVKTKQSNIQDSSTTSAIDEQVQSRPSTDKTNQSINSESLILPVSTGSKTSVGKINPPDLTHKITGVATTYNKQTTINTPDVIDEQRQSRSSTDKTNSINSESPILPMLTGSKTPIGKINPPDLTHKITDDHVATTNNKQTTINAPDVNISRNGSTVNDENSVKDNTSLDSKEPASKKKGWFRRIVDYIKPGKKS